MKTIAAVFSDSWRPPFPRPGRRRTAPSVKAGAAGADDQPSAQLGLSLREVMADEYTFNLDCLPLVEKLALLYEQKKEEANAFDLTIFCCVGWSSLKSILKSKSITGSALPMFW